MLSVFYHSEKSVIPDLKSKVHSSDKRLSVDSHIILTNLAMPHD
jgi:hypothetical protein